MRQLEYMLSGSPEWLELRRSKISASDIGVMLGLDEYQTPRELYHRKRGEIGPVEETQPMRMGKKLEPAIIETWCEDHAVEMDAVIYPCPCWIADDERFIATPDAILHRATLDRELIEAKSTTSFAPMWRMATRSELPDYIYCQAQWQMLCTDLEMCHVAILCDGRNLRSFDVARDDAVIKSVAVAAGEFWQRIQAGDPPDWDTTHPAYAEAVRRVYPEINGERVILSDAVTEKMKQREWIGSEIKSLEKDRDQLLAEVLAEMGCAEIGVLGDGRVVKRSMREATVIESYTRKAFIDVRCVTDPLTKRRSK